MTVTHQKPNPIDPVLRDATFSYDFGGIQFAAGVSQAQIDFLLSLPDEREAQRIVSSREATEILA